MAWQFRAQMTEACSCNMFCPCWFGVKEQMVMDEGWCAGSVSFEIEDGQSDGVDLSGRTVVLLVHWPGPTMFDGNGTGRVFIDEGAKPGKAPTLPATSKGQKAAVARGLTASLRSSWPPSGRTAIATR